MKNLQRDSESWTIYSLQTKTIQAFVHPRI